MTSLPATMARPIVLCTSSLITETMSTTSFAYGSSYSVVENYTVRDDFDGDFDDFSTAEDYDRRRAIRDGWYKETWDGR